MESVATTVELVHLAILQDAAAEANRRWSTLYDVNTAPAGRPIFNAEERKKRKRSFASGEVYRADPIRSTKGGLCLSVDESIAEGLDPEDLEVLHRIGRESIRWAIVENKDKFVGVILGEARSGRNYFSRFPDPHGQTKLF